MSKNVKHLLEQFVPEHYTLHINPDRKKLTFTGTVTIKGKKTGRPSHRLTLHQKDLKIDSAAITRLGKDKKDIVVDRINLHGAYDEVRLHSKDMLYPGQYEVTLEFHGTITRGMTGLYPCFFNKDGEDQILLATQFETHHAREAFPCIDEPAAKATFDFSVTHDTSATALGNMPIVKEEKSGDTTVTTFDTTPKMSVYLLAFAIGDVHRKTAKTKSGVEVNIYATSAQPADRLDFASDVAVKSIEFFEDYFDVPYPLPKADHIALPDFSSGAMENWGLITYREIALLLDPKASSQSAKELIAMVIAHETSHQWFGNLVTMEWWDDLWLNESFANMMEYEAINSIFPDWHIWNAFVAQEGLSAIRRDAIAGVQAVHTPVTDPGEISALFDPSIVYAKGGRLLYMLKEHLGEDDWRAGLKRYFEKHAYGNTTGSDLWAALTKSSHEDIGLFMTPWLTQSGFPIVSLSQNGDQITVHQKHYVENPEKLDSDRLWSVPLFLQDDSKTMLDTRSHDFSVKNDPAIINTGARGHYIVHYEDKSHRDKIAKLVSEGTLHTGERLMLLNDSTLLAKAGEASFIETLNLLKSYTAETAETVWDMMALVLADARKFIDYDESLDKPIKKLMRELAAEEVKRLGWKEKANESPEDAKLRATVLGLSAFAEEPTVTKKALSLFDAYKKNPTAVPAELRGIVFTTAVKQQHADAFDYLLKLHAETDSTDIQRDIAGAVCSTRQKTQAEKILKNIVDPKIVRPQDADRWFAYLIRNRHQRETAWNWLLKNWQWVMDTYGNDKNLDYWPRYCASVMNTTEWLERFSDFFNHRKNVTVIKRNIEIGKEEIAARAAWLERDLKDVQNFFH